MDNNKETQLVIFEQSQKAKKGHRDNYSALQPQEKSKFPTQACACASCIIIVVLAVFALGIERGKKIAKKENASPVSYITAETKADVQTTPVAIQPLEKTDQKKELAKKEKDVKLNTSQYIIQVATYKKDSSYIEKEIAKLEKKGYDAFVKTSGEYAIIYTGNFPDRKNAEAELEKLKKTYKDCFIKKLI